jgi:hypothetical protein
MKQEGKGEKRNEGKEEKRKEKKVVELELAS